MLSALRQSLIKAAKLPVQSSVIANKIHTTVSLDTNAKVAVVLSGCGVYDGSEIHESSAILVHLSRSGADISMFAPDVDQLYTMNHLKGEEMEPNRNVLVESARIARGKIDSIMSLKADDFDAVVFPGGFGAAKNLSNFAVDSTNMRVDFEVERIIKEFRSTSKPIGMCCIAPVLAAKVIPGCEVTVGHTEEEGGRWPYAGTVGAIQAMGAVHVDKDITEAHIDTENKVVTTPAFMCDTNQFHEVFDGIGEMIKGVMSLVKTE